MQQVPAVNRQRDTGHPSDIVAGEHDGHAGNVFGPAHPGQGMLARYVPEQLGLALDVLRHAGFEKAGAERVAVDHVRCVVQGDLFGQHHGRAFAGCV